MDQLRATLQDPLNPRTGVTPEMDPAKLGIFAEGTSPMVESQLGKGIVVKGVLMGGKGQKVGLQQWDLITTINGTKISSLEELRQTLKGLDDEKLTLEVIRAGKSTTLEEK